VNGQVVAQSGLGIPDPETVVRGMMDVDAEKVAEAMPKRDRRTQP
jgi:hypothetical protein